MPELTHISDTAVWVAYYRALESARKGALFHDPLAKKLIGDRGRRVAREMGRAWLVSWFIAIRTRVMDEIILELISSQRIEGVVNLACGLDTRPYRLPLPEDFLWIDVDYPKRIEEKNRLLASDRPHCKLLRIGADLSETSERQRCIGEIAGHAKSLLVLTEGLLVYLPSEKVKELLNDLGGEVFKWWLMDIYSEKLLKWVKRTSWYGKLSQANSLFQFAPEEGAKFFEPFGWSQFDYRGILQEARRLGRELPLFWGLRLLGRLSSRKRRESNRYLSGILLLKHNSKTNANS